MAKHIVKTSRYRRQARITLPGLLMKEMEWENVTFFVLQKVDGKPEVKITQLQEKDLK